MITLLIILIAAVVVGVLQVVGIWDNWFSNKDKDEDDDTYITRR